MNLPLYQHQQDGIIFIRENKKVLLAFSMRLGKSRTALEAALPEQKIMVVCPVIMKITWQREVAKWLGEDVTVQIVHKYTTEVDLSVRVLVVPYSIVNALLVNGDLPKPDYLIIDECHYCANWETKRSAASMYLLKKANMAALLSGTPVVNRPKDLWPIFLALRLFTNMHEYERRYCAAWVAPWGWDARGSSNLEELSHKLRHFMMPVGRDQVQGMPDVLDPLVIEMDLPVDKREKEFDREAIARNPSPVAFESMTDILKLSGERKAPLAVKHILNLLYDMNKIIVWFWHRDVGRLIQSKLEEAGIQTAYIDGSVPGTKRQDAIDWFNNEYEPRVILGQVNAMGVGVEIIGAYHNVFVEAPWSPALLWQAINRAWGPNQPEAHISTDILAIHRSIDSFVLHTILRKQDIINTLIYKETTVKKEDINSIDQAVRRLIDAAATEQKVTVSAYVKLLFPRSFPKAKAEAPAETVTPKGEPKEVVQPAAEEESMLPGAEPVEEESMLPGAEPAVIDPKGLETPIHVAEEITLDKVRFVLAETITLYDAPVVKKILTDHNASRLSELDPATYASVIDVCEDLIGAAAEAGAD